MKHLSIYTSLLATALIVTGCDHVTSVSEDDTKTRREKRFDRLGKFFGDDVFLYSPEKKRTEAAGIGVNSYLWRATLDVLSFMPLNMVDPFGGVILTDWHTLGSQTERVKVDVRILAQDLRADGLRISVFKQVFQKGQWVDTPTDPMTAQELEEAILIKARQMKVDEGK